MSDTFDPANPTLSFSRAVRLSERKVGTILKKQSEVEKLKEGLELIEVETRGRIEAAEARASEIIATAEAERQRLQSELEAELEQTRNAAMERLKEKLTVEAQTQRKIASDDLLKEFADTLRRINNDFEDITPWLQTLVQRCIGEVLGRLSQEEILTMIIKKQLSKMKERWELRLTVHPDNLHAVETALEASGEMGNIVKRVAADDTLDTDECCFFGPAGLQTTGLRFRIEQVMTMLACGNSEISGTSGPQTE